MAIGAIVGLLVVAFILVTENLGARMYPAGGAAWRRVVIPTLGALIAGFLLHHYFPGARGSGIPQTKTALFLHGGVIRFRTVVGKFLCSSVSLASGIALGREGPSVQVGAGIASALGQRMGLSPSRIKSLIPIGSSAAVAAAFNTPIAAVLFTLEEVMGDLHAPVMGAVVLSSATSWMVLHLLLGDEPLFHVPAYQLVHPSEFLLYAALGVVGGLVSTSFVKLLLWQRKKFQSAPGWTTAFQPVAGGLMVGLMGWVVPDVLGVGYGHVSQALNGQLLVGAMALLTVLKVVATATCYASGNAGGIFGPSLFIGAMMGGAVGGVAHGLLPDYTGSAGAYALVGMGAAFAGIIRVPLTSVIMIFEVTRDYSIIVPLMIANLISYFISSRLQPEPIYEALLRQDGIRLPPSARSREELATVEQGVRPASLTLSPADTAEEALSRAPAHERAWPVVDAGGLLGMAARDNLAGAIKEGRGRELVAPGASNVFLHPDDPLDTAMRRMAQSGLDTLPVVSRSNDRELLGVISMQDALAAYASQGKAEEPAYKESRTPTALLGGVLVVLAAMAALAGFLNYYYREERAARAAQSHQHGNQLLAKERYDEAIAQYRSALSISHNPRDRLALAQALEKAGRPGEAAIYFGEILRDAPGSGPANLGMGRVAAVRGDARETVDYYHRAIYGSWPDQQEARRLEARFELVEALGRLGKRQEAQAELLSLAAEAPEDAAAEKRMGRLLIEFDLPQQAEVFYRKALAKDRRDASALMGLGEAQLAADRYRQAMANFQAAQRLAPGDPRAAARVHLVERLLALDPAVRGLRARDRYERSRQLLAAALGSLEECLGAMIETLSPVKKQADAVRKTLRSRARPRSYADAAEANLASATQLWETRTQLCGSSKTPDEPLSRILDRLAASN